MMKIRNIFCTLLLVPSLGAVAAEPGAGVPAQEETFTDLTPGVVSRLWDFGNGTSSTEANPSELPGTLSGSVYVRNEILELEARYERVDQLAAPS